MVLCPAVSTVMLLTITLLALLNSLPKMILESTIMFLSMDGESKMILDFGELKILGDPPGENKDTSESRKVRMLSESRVGVIGAAPWTLGLQISETKRFQTICYPSQ
jgi:hypothetical protein